MNYIFCNINFFTYIINEKYVICFEKIAILYRVVLTLINRFINHALLIKKTNATIIHEIKSSSNRMYTLGRIKVHDFCYVFVF